MGEQHGHTLASVETEPSDYTPVGLLDVPWAERHPYFFLHLSADVRWSAL